MTDAEAIRAAIAAIADEAHPAARIRATLDAHARRYRQRRLVLRTAGALAAAGVAGAGGLAAHRLTRPGPAVFPQIPGGPGGGWLSVRLGWRPAWLPDGFGLTGLGAVVGGSAVVAAEHVWTRPQRPGERSEPFVSVNAGWSPTYAGSPAVARTDRADIGGVRAELTTYADDNGVLLAWQPATGPRLAVSAGTGEAERDRAVAVRIARSLRPDPGSFAVGPRPGWLPAPFAAQPWLWDLRVAEQQWVQNLLVRSGGAELTLTFAPRLQPFFDLATARPVDVGGGEAWLEQQRGELFARGLGGLDLELGGIFGDDAVRVVREFDFGPGPDMSWYGTR